VTVAELRRWVAEAPAGTTIPAAALLELLEGLEVAPPASAETLPTSPDTWRERLWSVPAETRLGVAEVAEALARPRSYVYARTGPKADDPLPHRKLDGAVVVTAGELRAWIRAHEEVVHAGPMESAPSERSLRAS
jgi:hypothetical protein